jgi:hypothetical protein
LIRSCLPRQSDFYFLASFSRYSNPREPSLSPFSFSAFQIAMSFNARDDDTTNLDIMERVASATGTIVHSASIGFRDVCAVIKRGVVPAVEIATAVARDIRPAAFAAADVACSNQQSLASVVDAIQDIKSVNKKISNRVDLIEDCVYDIQSSLLTTNNILFALLSDGQKMEYDRQRLAQEHKEDVIEIARERKRALKGDDYTDRRRARLYSPAPPAYSPTSPAYSPTSPAQSSSSVESVE